jgi:uncharacterized protein YndB with AHSA1/START domain
MMTRGSLVSLLALTYLALPGLDARADVVDKTGSGFTVRTTVTVAAAPQRVYRDLLNVGAWWDKEHTYSGDAKNMTLLAQPGGCFCEKYAGGAIEHGRVVNVSPDKLLRLSAALGPLQELATAGTMTWTIEAAKQGSGSMLTMTYAAGGYAPGGLDKLADIVDAVLAQQVKLLKAYAEKNR